MTSRREPDFAALASALSVSLGSRCRSVPERSVHGGSINECYQWRTDAGPVFVKVAERGQLNMLEAEADGLKELAAARALRIPAVLGVGIAEPSSRHALAFLALEWIDAGPASADSERKLGERLAAQHAVARPAFGWHRSNTIGRTPQINTQTADWVEFFREHRLRYQLDLACHNGYAAELREKGERLLELLGGFFSGARSHVPQASLLHGDLWGGNWLTDARGDPVIFDPAVYFGDRETDWAMTRLFGGFGAEFYRAYQAAAPLDDGAEARAALYNLYHVLNHANLFGGGYVRQAGAMIERLLSDC